MTNIHTSLAKRIFCRAVLVEPELGLASVDSEGQLDEVIQIRVENEQVETEPLLQPQASMVSLPMYPCHHLMQL